MSPLAHFVRPEMATWVDTQIYWNPIVLSYNNIEFDRLTKIGVPFENNSSIKATFNEDDKLRDVLLKDNPKDLRLDFYDKEGKTIRVIYMRQCECKELPNYEVEILYEKFEDFYF